MSDRHDDYESPLVTRYAGAPMRRLFSARRRIEIWRDLWIALASAEHELGLPITAEQVEALRGARDDIDFDKAAAYEARFRHDVMAHVHAFGDAAPEARGILHMGATSCFVTDNADALVLREALQRTEVSLANACAALADFAEAHADVPCLAYTHFQPAQPTTVGKRACLWLQDLLADLEAVRAAIKRVPFRGSKGTTGTQASFLGLFDGDAEKCEELDRLVAKKMGFETPVPVTGQTYPRRSDYDIVAVLGGVAVSSMRFAHDVRLLSGLRELAEPFEKEQIGSSAMAYKQNPMRTERITSLARHVIALVPEAAMMAGTQWLERTLDDSAGRRIFLPEAFLGVDAVLRLVTNVARGLHVNTAVARMRLMNELPFMATEDILLRATRAGGDRQELHERVRQHSLAAKEQVLSGLPNDLLDRLKGDPAFRALDIDWADLMTPERYTGLASRQTRLFLVGHALPALASCQERFGEDASVRV